MQDFISQLSAKREVKKVVIDAERDIIKYFGEQKYYHGFIKEEDAGDYIRLTFLCGSLQGFAGGLWCLGIMQKLLNPFELNDLVAGIAENILKKIEINQMLPL